MLAVLRMNAMALVWSLLAAVAFGGAAPQGAPKLPAEATTPPSSMPHRPPAAPPQGAPAPPADARPPANTIRAEGNLSSVPLKLEGLGVSLRVPSGSTVEQLPGPPSWRIDDARETPRYFIRAQAMVASAATSSPQLQFEQHLRFLGEKQSEFTVIRDLDLDFHGARGKLAYIAIPAGEGVTAITGWLVIQTGPNTFVVFSIITSGVDFPAVEALLAESFETIDLSTLEETAAAQLSKRDRTRKFLDSISKGKLRALADGRPRWFRLYRPGAGRDGTDLEMGFLRIKSFEGERGEVSSSSTSGSQDAPEMGLIVEVVAKMLVDGKSGHTVDIQSRFWQAWDRGAESWSTVSTERLAGALHTLGQTGWRARSMSTNERGSILTVINSLSHSANGADQLKSRQPSEWEIPPEGYLNQAELVLLGSLLPRDGSMDGEFSFYCYDTRSNKLPQRVDRWAPDPEASGRYSLTSRASAESPEIKQLFSAGGERLRRIDADGLVTEAIEHADLLRLWKSKGLPTG